MKKKITAVLSLFLALSLLLSVNAFAINDQTPAYKAHLTFGSDGKFTILQLADIQDLFLMLPIALMTAASALMKAAASTAAATIMCPFILQKSPAS
ncbi:MAG: hypothetical protein WCN92_03410 [Eubacteriales bacterium]